MRKSYLWFSIALTTQVNSFQILWVISCITLLTVLYDPCLILTERSLTSAVVTHFFEADLVVDKTISPSTFRFLLLVRGAENKLPVEWNLKASQLLEIFWHHCNDSIFFFDVWHLQTCHYKGSKVSEFQCDNSNIIEITGLVLLQCLDRRLGWNRFTLNLQLHCIQQCI